MIRARSFMHAAPSHPEEPESSPVHLFYVARPFQASHVGAALLAWDSLMAVCGHPGSAAHLGGARAGWVFHRYGLLAPRRAFPCGTTRTNRPGRRRVQWYSPFPARAPDAAPRRGPRSNRKRK